MHAFAPALPLSAVKTALIRPDRIFPARDPFKSVLQGRLVAHLKRGERSQAGARQASTSPGGDLRTGVNRRAEKANSRQVRELADRQVAAKARRVPPERLPEAAALLLQAGFPPELLQKLLADPQVQEEGLSLADLRRVWLEPRTEAQTVGESLSEGSLPPALSSLLELIEQSPGGVLPVPASRQPEIAALLAEAGFTPDQVENLISSPQVQEQGLTGEVLRAAWLKALQALQEPGESCLPESDLQVTSQAGYHRLWERLRLPLEAMPNLRLALQQLGASPEALAGLEEHATPQGVPVGQVWQVIKQCCRDGQGASSQAGPASPAKESPLLSSPPSGEDLAQWRQLLVEAGFSPEVVDGLLSTQTPASAAELRARLAALAPSTPPPETQDAPKPLYMPENLRLRSMWWENQDSPDPDMGESKDGQTLLSNPGKSGPTSFFAGENQGTFASLLAPATALSSSQGAPVDGSLSGQWSPGVRQVFWSQLEAGILGSLKPGESRLNLMLNPPELGQVELILNLTGENLAVTVMIARPEVAHLAGSGVEQLVQALSQHGLVLSQFQVQVRERGLESINVAAAEQKAMHKKEQGSGGGESARRRRNTRVDRFV